MILVIEGKLVNVERYDYERWKEYKEPALVDEDGKEIYYRTEFWRLLHRFYKENGVNGQKIQITIEVVEVKG